MHSDFHSAVLLINWIKNQKLRLSSEKPGGAMAAFSVVSSDGRKVIGDAIVREEISIWNKSVNELLT